MPRYLLRFKVLSCLTHNQDLMVSYGEHQPTFLFSKKRAEDNHVWIQLELQAANNRLAQQIASS